MPKIQLSYHIADFKLTDNNEFKILEFGNAFYASDFSKRAKQEINNKEKMMNHACQLGSIELVCPVLRSSRHMYMRLKNHVLNDTVKKWQNPQTDVKIKLVTDASNFEAFIYEHIQELRAQYNAENQLDIVFDGVIDSFFLCNHDKRLLHNLLKLHHLDHYQPETWYYSLDSHVPFIPQKEAAFFIIKPTNETRAQGIVLAANHELLPILENLGKKQIINEQQGNTAFDYYQFDKDGRGNKANEVLIQAFYSGKIIEHEQKKYRTTGRAVFAVVKSEQGVAVEIIDIFWKLAKNSLTDTIPVYNESITTVEEDIASLVSLSDEEYKQISATIKPILMEISAAFYGCDIKDFLLKMIEDNQVDNIKYYLKKAGNRRVDRLDEELISALEKIDPELTYQFLINQAKVFSFAVHLKFKNEFLANWIINSLPKLNSNLLNDLKNYFQGNLENLKTYVSSDKEQLVNLNQEYLNSVQTAINQTHTSNSASFFSTNVTQNTNQALSDNPRLQAG